MTYIIARKVNLKYKERDLIKKRKKWKSIFNLNNETNNNNLIILIIL
jgi:hypothetical protein